MLAWKLFRVMKNGALAPLFINKRLRLEIGVWYEAELHVTKGFSPRKGWHVTAACSAPHLRTTGSDRVWKQVEIEDYTELKRPESQGGMWYLANRMRVL
jgi:hypothetical protein